MVDVVHTFLEMRTLQTDEIVVEFDGHLHGCVVVLDRLLRGHHKDFPEKSDLWWDTQEAIDVYTDLVRRLDAKSPDDYFFGGHPYQPTCLGFWPKH